MAPFGLLDEPVASRLEQAATSATVCSCSPWHYCDLTEDEQAGRVPMHLNSMQQDDPSPT